MRARILALSSILVAVGALAVLLFFANQDDRVRNDALLFLDRWDGIEVDDPLEERRTRIDALDRLGIGADEVDLVRDQCVAAHRTLIRAEDSGALARVAFDRATEGGGEEAEIPTETRATIEAALQESNAALESAREQMPRCMSAVHSLELRFQPQRARSAPGH